jgi:hypothetical protein
MVFVIATSQGYIVTLLSPNETLRLHVPTLIIIFFGLLTSGEPQAFEPMLEFALGLSRKTARFVGVDVAHDARCNAAV